MPRSTTVPETASGKTRILIIPHQPHRNVKVRAVEMARYLASLGQYEVFILTWALSDSSGKAWPAKLGHKCLEAFKTTGLPVNIISEGGLSWVSLPYLLAPYPFCQEFNWQQLSRFVQMHQIQTIISGNAYHFPMPDAPLRIYDVVDDHISPNSGPHWRRTRQFTFRELEKSDHIITITHALQEVLANEGFPHARRIPNGVDHRAFQQTLPTDIQAFRAQYQLNDCFTIGYIGNHGWWAGMDLLLEAFKRLKHRVPQSKLMIIGPGEDLPQYRHQLAGNPDVIFTGPIPPSEIAACFHAIDIGVLPFQICPFTDNALPLKVLEYGAARKQVLATPLKELKTLAFPHVQLLEPDPEAWAAALASEAEFRTPWNPDWDVAIAVYDWPVVLSALPSLLEMPHAASV